MSNNTGKTGRAARPVFILCGDPGNICQAGGVS